MFRFRLYKVRQFFLERFKSDLKTKVVRAAKSNFKEPIGNSIKKIEKLSYQRTLSVSAEFAVTSMEQSQLFTLMAVILKILSYLLVF